VYTTLQRLERDGMVAEAGADDEGRQRYRITDAGRADIDGWFAAPVERAVTTRDEVSLKVLLAAATGLAPTAAVLRTQRQATMQALQDYTGLKARARTEEVAWLLHLDRLILVARAELQWLDLAEERLAAQPSALQQVTHPDGEVDVWALRDVSIEVRPGELVAVTGRSGSGKSTLLNLAGGLDQVTEGSVRVAGQELGGLSAQELARLRRRHLGFVFQDLNLLPTLTAVENVMLPLELDRVRASDARRLAAASLDEVGAGGLADRYPDQLSGGQRQRVAIARALVGPRTLLLADEPTAALDEVTGEEILRVIRARCDGGAGGLLVTHDPAQAAWADRVIRLRDGGIDTVTERSDPAQVLAELRA
jgi:putative ABC transport system ATP-binding protein